MYLTEFFFVCKCYYFFICRMLGYKFVADKVATISAPKFDSLDLVFAVIRLCNNLRIPIEQSKTYPKDIANCDFLMNKDVNSLVIHSLDLVMPSVEIFEDAISKMGPKVLAQNLLTAMKRRAFMYEHLRDPGTIDISCYLLYRWSEIPYLGAILLIMRELCFRNLYNRKDIQSPVVLYSVLACYIDIDKNVLEYVLSLTSKLAQNDPAFSLLSSSYKLYGKWVDMVPPSNQRVFGRYFPPGKLIGLLAPIVDMTGITRPYNVESLCLYETRVVEKLLSGNKEFLGIPCGVDQLLILDVVDC